jgi:hypothetical protein
MSRSTLSDIFFYNELCSTLGHVRAEHWLATDASSSTASGSFGDENELGEKVGMLFTDTSNQLLDSPRSVASTCSSRCSTLSTNPQRRLPTLADFFFYNELRSTLGHVLAEHWLATATSQCIPSRPVSQAGPGKPRNRTRSAHECPVLRSAKWLATASCEAKHGKSQPGGECDIARLMNEHGEKVGLLFTDAAHEILDSPRSVASNCSRREQALS